VAVGAVGVELRVEQVVRVGRLDVERRAAVEPGGEAAVHRRRGGEEVAVRHQGGQRAVAAGAVLGRPGERQERVVAVQLARQLVRRRRHHVAELATEDVAAAGRRRALAAVAARGVVEAEVEGEADVLAPEQHDRLLLAGAAALEEAHHRAPGVGDHQLDEVRRPRRMVDAQLAHRRRQVADQ
jgi:hypothetical protein